MQFNERGAGWLAPDGAMAAIPATSQTPSMSTSLFTLAAAADAKPAAASPDVEDLRFAAADRRDYAIHEAGHFTLAELLGHREHYAWMEPADRGWTGNHYIFWRRPREHRVAVAMGGALASELWRFGARMRPLRDIVCDGASDGD
jgi:hypothetical protein